MSHILNLFLVFLLSTALPQIINNCNTPQDCTDGELCDPNTNTCTHTAVLCNKGGEFQECYDTGFIISTCASGADPVCGKTEIGCDAEVIASGVCNYAGLVPNGGFEATSWVCGVSGLPLSCQSFGGSVLIGMCGSGGGANCTQSSNCPSNAYHAIKCADTKSFPVNWANCYWVGGLAGSYLECNNPGDVITGRCGSGSNQDCVYGTNGPFTHMIQCCPLKYGP